MWKHPSAVVQKSRAWRRASGAVITRARGEGYLHSDQHLIALPLTDYGDATIHVDGGAAQRLPTTAQHLIGFRPAGISIRTTVCAPTYSYAAIFQDPEIYRGLASEVSSSIDTGYLGLKPGLEAPQAAQLIAAIIAEMSGHGLDHLLVDALHIALALQIARHFQGAALRPLPAGRLSRQRLERVLDYIEAHLGSLTLGDLAGVACLSPYHFSRCFARSMGVGPHRYVMGRRIARARDLLLHSDLSLADIADVVGFDSQASFTSRFGRELGISPGRLRKQLA
jgi:AraC family transcriptional regulator